MKERQEYFTNGFITRRFKRSKSLERLNTVLLEINSNKIKEDFTLESKYPSTFDLRPNVYDYDDVLLDILFENNIPLLLKSLTGEDLTLCHVQVRRSIPSDTSYMPWHRDIYFIDDRIVGNVPPAHKIIFYPTVENESNPKLEILKGRFLKMEIYFLSP